MAVRLRYLAHDLEVPTGEFLIGRTSDCQLSLDDALVSRRHAILVVETDGVFIEDLASRNGVFLNGQRIDRVTRVNDGDVIRIGSQELTLYGLGEAPVDPSSRPRSAHISTMQDIRIEDLIRDEAAPTAKPKAPVQPGRATVRNVDLDALDDDDHLTNVALNPMPSADPGKRVHGLSLIGGVADKALAMGRTDEAERILQRALADVLLRAPKGEIPLELAEKAISYAIRLAGATGRGAWVNYIFELYTILRALLPARLVDELYAVVRKVKHTDKNVLRSYTACLREISNGFGPAERFIQQRIESFERWAP